MRRVGHGHCLCAPWFIETVPRRGYRFIGSIQDQSTFADPIPQAPIALVAEAEAKRARKLWILLALGAIAIVSLATWIGLRWPKSTGPIQVQQLTTKSAENPVWQSVISPDGKYLAYGDLAGSQSFYQSF